MTGFMKTVIIIGLLFAANHPYFTFISPLLKAVSKKIKKTFKGEQLEKVDKQRRREKRLTFLSFLCRQLSVGRGASSLTPFS